MESKTYTSSNGETMSIDTMETTHLTNAMAKKMREVFNASTKEQAYETINIVNDLKEEAFKRINTFIETLGDDNGE